MIGSDELSRKLSLRDVLLITLAAAALYLPAVLSGRPLSVHEGRLPQLAREMVWGKGDWLLPTSGGRPWLERPPLPHWLTAASMMMFGRAGSLWSPRLPAALAGLSIGLLAAWMTARCLGCSVGLLAGIITLSSYELYQYSTLAEDDVYLALVAVGCVAAFAYEHWSSHPALRPSGFVRDFVGGRSLATLLFFTLLGLTNLAKGPLVGAAPVVGTLGVYLLWNRDKQAIRNYTWLWGWLIVLLLTAAWPVWAVKHYPDVIDNWRFDYLGKSTAEDPLAAEKWNHPFWYYPTMLPLALAPWSWAAIIGLIGSAGRAWRAKRSFQRFIFCWAIISLCVLSIPARKHHQYLVPIIAPWAILSALGLIHLGQWIRSKRPQSRALQGMVVAVVIVFVVVGGYVQLFVAGRDPRTMAELKLLQYARYNVPPSEPVLINGDVDSLGFFRLQYGLRHDQKLIQNLSYLRDSSLNRPKMYVLTRAADEPYLATLGSVKVMADASVAGENRSDGHQFALFELAPTPDLQRFTPPPYIGVLQAMGRQKGPWLGDGIVPRP